MGSENKSGFRVTTSRLETLWGGVFTIAVTLLVLEMSLPDRVYISMAGGV